MSLDYIVFKWIKDPPTLTIKEVHLAMGGVYMYGLQEGQHINKPVSSGIVVRKQCMIGRVAHHERA